MICASLVVLFCLTIPSPALASGVTVNLTNTYYEKWTNSWDQVLTFTVYPEANSTIIAFCVHHHGVYNKCSQFVPAVPTGISATIHLDNITSHDYTKARSVITAHKSTNPHDNVPNARSFRWRYHIPMASTVEFNNVEYYLKVKDSPLATKTTLLLVIRDLDERCAKECKTGVCLQNTNNKRVCTVIAQYGRTKASLGYTSTCKAVPVQLVPYNQLGSMTHVSNSPYSYNMHPTQVNAFSMPAAPEFESPAIQYVINMEITLNTVFKAYFGVALSAWLQGGIPSPEKPLPYHESNLRGTSVYSFDTTSSADSATHDNAHLYEVYDLQYLEPSVIVQGQEVYMPLTAPRNLKLSYNDAVKVCKGGLNKDTGIFKYFGAGVAPLLSGKDEAALKPLFEIGRHLDPTYAVWTSSCNSVNVCTLGSCACTVKSYNGQTFHDAIVAAGARKNFLCSRPIVH